MSDILRQVDEDLRKERLSEVWRKYGIYALVLVTMIVLSVIAYQINTSRNDLKNQEIIEEYLIATNLEDEIASLKNLKQLEESSHKLISGIVKLRISDHYLINNDKESSSAKLLEIITGTEHHVLISDLALYNYLMLNIQDLDDSEFEKYISMAKSDNIDFEYLLKELNAIRHLLLDRKDLSKQLFQEIINIQNLPINIKSRAEKFISIIE